MEEIAAMVMRSCASLCERCEHYDWQYTKYGREACDDFCGTLGEAKGAHRFIWCAEPRFKELS